MIGKRGIVGMYPPRCCSLANSGAVLSAMDSETTNRGPLGLRDSSSPDHSAQPAFTPGPLGHADAFDGNPNVAVADLAAVVTAGTTTGATPVPSNQFEFSSKKFRKTSKTLQQCYNQLPSEFTGTFLENVKKTIKDMHDLGFAFAPAREGGFRTFQEQNDLKIQPAGYPGESFHNYAIAVDLGCWQWIDEQGVEHNYDWWLKIMSKAYGGCDSKIWDKRDEFAKTHGLVPGLGERIHLQPANKQRVGILAALLNKVVAGKPGGSKYKYEKPPEPKGNYKSDFGKGGDYYNIGTAKQMWAGSAAVSDADVKKAFPDLTPEQRAEKKKEIIQNIKKDMQLADENWKEVEV